MAVIERWSDRTPTRQEGSGMVRAMASWEDEVSGKTFRHGTDRERKSQRERERERERENYHGDKHRFGP